MYMKHQVYKKFWVFLGIIFLIFIIGLGDFLTGLEFNFCIFYFIPIGIVAWFFGFDWVIFFSIVCGLIWIIVDNLSGHHYSSTFFAVWNNVVRLSVFLMIGWFIYKNNTLLQTEKTRRKDIEKALSEVKILERFLPICCVCKKIRNENGDWEQIEKYISGHSETVFSHSYCPECFKKATEEAEL